MNETSRVATPDSLNPALSRIQSLDALRGVAVLGIFAINIIGFAFPEIAFSNPKVAGGEGALNYGLWSFTTVFIEGSMRGLFSLVFGAGVILFTARADDPVTKRPVAALYYRRTSWLIAFGLIHGYLLLMPGDILLIYGIAGLFLFTMRKAPPSWQLAAAAAFLVGLVSLAVIEEWDETQLGLAARAIETRIEEGVDVSDADQAKLDKWQEIVSRNWPDEDELNEIIEKRTGDIATVYADNTEIMGYSLEPWGNARWVADALMMMLLGMAFFKWRIITGDRSAKFYAIMLAAGYAIGVSFRLWAVVDRWEADFSPILWSWAAFYQIGRVAMTIGHIGLFFLLWKIASSSLPMRALAAAGRMAFSNYIGQTVIANLIFTGVGLGLYGSMDRASVYLVMFAIWGVQLAFSFWWLARYNSARWNGAGGH